MQMRSRCVVVVFATLLSQSLAWTKTSTSHQQQSGLVRSTVLNRDPCCKIGCHADFFGTQGKNKRKSGWSSTGNQYTRTISSLRAVSEDKSSEGRKVDLAKVGLFGTVAFLYWYWMVFGALAASQGWPGIPDGLPLVPGWPISNEELQPILDDSRHFFYLSELLLHDDAPFVQPVRLAAFNVAEAWIFAFLPVLWSDPRRVNKYLLLGTWALLGINLTNAFLAPYLLVTELLGQPDAPTVLRPKKDLIFTGTFGVVALAVVGFATQQILMVATANDWGEFFELIQSDRTYLAFCVDLVLFSVFQIAALGRVRQARAAGVETESLLRVTDYIPFFGLVLWLFEGEDDV